jgi:hypothetical protein
MKNKPSESTERLTESLYTKKGLWDRFVQPASQDEVIRHIAAAGEPAVIPDLLPILITGDRKSILAEVRHQHCDFDIVFSFFFWKCFVFNCDLEVELFS